MVASWFMARRPAGVRPSVIGALWPLVIDLIALAGFAFLIMGIVVSSAYAEPRNDGPWPMVAMLGGIVVFAVSLSQALISTWRAMRAR